jgi:transcriptional regulator with XRE-family HTH domain
MTPEQELIWLRTQRADGLARYIGTRAKQARRERQETQAAFAARAGIPLRTYKRLESQGQGSLETFLKVLIALERGHYLHVVFPAPAVDRVPIILQSVAALAKSNLYATMKPRNLRRSGDPEGA